MATLEEIQAERNNLESAKQKIFDDFAISQQKLKIEMAKHPEKTIELEQEIEALRKNSLTDLAKLRETEAEIDRKELPLLIEQGKQYIYPDKHQEWADSVTELLEGDFHLIIKNVLEIMKFEAEGATPEQIREIFSNQNHSRTSNTIAQNLVIAFSKTGPETIMKAFAGTLTPQQKAYIQEKKNENAILAQKYSGWNND